jgi:radical SAM protein with 4Fe4S-binding SPASM domain
MTPEIARLCKDYCGAVAVSWYRNEYTLRAIEMLLDAGVRTNIHYVLGKNSIDEAITRLENDDFPQGINSVVFLLHKPVGLGTNGNVLSPHDTRVTTFFRQVDQGKRGFKVGLDSCSVPGVMNFCKNVIPEAIDTCECARFSCYIGPDMIMTPCSFDQENRYGVSLRDFSIEEAWNSEAFEQFRTVLKKRCPDCDKRENCMGGCPLCPEIVLCKAFNN